MLASYAISRTLTPITIGLLLKNGRPGANRGQPAAPSLDCMAGSSVVSNACGMDMWRF